MTEKGVKIKYLVGTMIEVPRGAMTADQIAAEAQFFSFGTNDLTQMTFGFSRDDIGKFLRVYQDKKILDKDPFATIDIEGVGALVRIGVEKGRAARPSLKVGICGEHGGDPASVHFFESVKLDYVSASPYRIPVARLAAAQAAHVGQGRGLITYYVHRGRLHDPGWSTIDPSWLDPGSNATVWADVRQPDTGRRRAAATAFRLPPAGDRRRAAVLAVPEGRDRTARTCTSSSTASISSRRTTRSRRIDIDFFLGANYLVTVHDGSRRSIAEVAHLCARNDFALAEGPVALMHRIVDGWSITTGPRSTNSKAGSTTSRGACCRTIATELTREILAVKRDISSMRRVVIPQRDVVGASGAPRVRPDRSGACRIASAMSTISSCGWPTKPSCFRIASPAFSTRTSPRSRISWRWCRKVLAGIAVIFGPLTVFTGTVRDERRAAGVPGRPRRAVLVDHRRHGGDHRRHLLLLPTPRWL